jgi:hypothetical protein
MVPEIMRERASSLTHLPQPVVWGSLPKEEKVPTVACSVACWGGG